jgi:hypothetical protein
MGKDYKQLIFQPVYSREPLKYPTLASSLSLEELKRHFSYCAENCGSVKTFETLWLGRLQHWIERLNLNKISHETVALNKFLRRHSIQIRNIQSQKISCIS